MDEEERNRAAPVPQPADAGSKPPSEPVSSDQTASENRLISLVRSRVSATQGTWERHRAWRRFTSIFKSARGKDEQPPFSDD